MIGTHPGQFERTRLPDIESYCRDQGIELRGHGAERRGPCPIGDHSRRDNLAVNVDRGVWQCMAGCGAGDVLALHQAITGLAFADAARELGAWTDTGFGPVDSPSARQPLRQPIDRQEDDRADRERKRRLAADIWRAARVIEPGTPAWQYLAGRSCLMPPADGDLRWYPDLSLFGFAGPAIVGRISDILDASRGLGLHLTWLRRDGDRWARDERRYLGRKASGVVRLWPDEAVTAGLAIGEGIETTLAGAHLRRPAWACCDAGGLGQFPVLPGIEALTVYADRDLSGTGQQAAVDVADRWLDSGREVTILTASEIGRDVADEALSWLA